MMVFYSLTLDAGTCTFFLNDPACVKLILGVPLSGYYAGMLDSLVGEDRVVMIDGITTVSDQCQMLFNFQTVTFPDVFKDVRPAPRIPIHDPGATRQIVPK